MNLGAFRKTVTDFTDGSSRDSHFKQGFRKILYLFVSLSKLKTR